MIGMRWLTGIVGLLWLSAPCAAAPTDSNKVMAGWLEPVYLSELPQHRIKAKLDTGAKTSSINARDIESCTPNGKSWVRFELALKGAQGKTQAIPLERPLLRTVLVKEHSGEPGKRPVVTLELCFNGAEHQIEFTLVDRSGFNYPVLLGRRFLAGVAVIDPQSTYLTQPDCKAVSGDKATADAPVKS
jgi:hypothetical protein